MRQLLFTAMFFIFASTNIWAQGEEINKKAEKYYVKAIDAMEAADFEEALDNFNKYIKYEPNDHNAYHKRSTTKIYTGDYEGALNDLQKVLKLKPNFYEVNLEISRIFMAAGDIDEAERHVKKALAADKEFAAAYFQYAEIYFAKDQLEQACAELDKAKQLGHVPSIEASVKLCPKEEAAEEEEEEEAYSNIQVIRSIKDISNDPTYGYDSNKPIMVGRSSTKDLQVNIRDFLSLLRDAKGNVIIFDRVGQCCPYESENAKNGVAYLDKYAITYYNKKGEIEYGQLFFSTYDYKKPQAPNGLFFVQN